MRCAKQLIVAFTALTVVVLLHGCSGCAKEPRHAVLEWSEPVQLASGEIVTIKRHVEMWHERAFGGGYSSAPVYKTNSVELDPISREFPRWNAPLVPMVIDKDPANGDWIIVASIDECGMWARNGRPSPPYWAFRLRQGEWFRDSLPHDFIDRAANLFVEVDTTDTSETLNDNIVARKQSQLQMPKHAKKYGRIGASTRFEHCDPRPSNPIGQRELDLSQFRSIE